METRELRYFVAVAEALNFSRAARRLGISQPPLSRAIQQLERRLGTTLLERDSQAVRLTPSGTVLLREARVAIAAVDAAVRRTQRAGENPDGIRLAAKAAMGGELLADLLKAYEAVRPDVTVEVVLVGMGESEPMLRDGRVDVAVLTLPFDDASGLDHEVLGVGGRVALLPPGHELGERPGLTLDEVASIPGLPLARWPEPDGSYAYGPGPEIHDPLQLLHLVSLGRACAVICETCPTTIGGTELTVVPVPEADPVTTVIAWPAHSRSGPLADLVRTAVPF
ncbi:LysR family transcriptional regulator [Kineosporia succinea]|uniref:DNA-binding transcriptional LysR family regulator n=1 Tax=Kineosporia succinea TaxID=84632 RepID=A0ABT9NX36_9ACTN|nr:LysR family transcriptional regulator [Kineosporia succinea]MDP9824405.1 DNA-binding transcriptional LysR family regulator [Kineosporia succinea]